MISSPARTARCGSSSWAMGRPEKGEDSVAHQPGQGTLVAVNRRDQVLKGPVHDLGPVFGVQLFSRRRGTGNVAEQHGDHAAFTLRLAAGAGRFKLGQQLPGDVLF